MAEKRSIKRQKRRLKVRYGARDFSTMGYTVDISSRGMFIAANTLPTLQSRLHVQLFPSENDSVFFETEVRRHVQLPASMRFAGAGIGQVVNGFGVRFLPPNEVLAPIFGGDPRLEVSFANKDALRMSFVNELKHGALLIPTEQMLPLDTKVIVSVALDFASASLEFPAKVAHIMERRTGAAMNALGLALASPKDAAAALAPYMT